MMELGVAMAREAAVGAPGVAAQLPELEKALGEARPALARLTAQTRAQALAALGGNEAALESELAKVRPDYAALDAADATNPEAFLPTLQRLESDLESSCPAAADSPGSTAPAPAS